jgi:zinc finger MYND domain-containing protein 10
MEDLLARGMQAGRGANKNLLTAPEAERIVDSLQKFSLEQIGCSQWLEQQDQVQRLNVQSHHNAMEHADEFVKDLLVSYDKVTTLVHELLLMEIWNEKLLPLLKKHLAKRVDSITVYVLTSHEANLANLLEVTLFHEQAMEDMEEDHLIELVDWCQRQLHYLNTDAYKDAEYVERTAKVQMPVCALPSTAQLIDAFAV